MMISHNLTDFVPQGGYRLVVLDGEVMAKAFSEVGVKAWEGERGEVSRFDTARKIGFLILVIDKREVMSRQVCNIGLRKRQRHSF